MPVNSRLIYFNVFNSKNLTLIFLLFISGNIFAAEVQPKLDASCTAKEFEAVKLKQNCLLKPGQDNSCMIGTMTEAMHGSSVAQANLIAFSADLPEDLKNRLSKVVDKVKELSRVGGLAVTRSLTWTRWYAEGPRPS